MHRFFTGSAWAGPVFAVRRSVPDLHGLAAAAGDDLARLHVQDLVADRAVDIAFLLCPDHGAQAGFQFVFHGILLKKQVGSAHLSVTK